MRKFLPKKNPVGKYFFSNGETFFLRQGTKSDLTNGEILGNLTFEILQIELDFAEVFLQISGGHEFLFTNDEFLRIVDADYDNGDTGFQGYVIEAFLPVGIGLAGTFGGNGQVENFATVAGIDHLIDQRIAATAIDGHSSHGTEYRSQGPEEPLLLHHELSLATNGGIEQFADEEIPVAGVGTTTDDILGMVGYGDLGFPT